MCGALALVFIATTAAEVYVLVKVGGLIGALSTFGIIIATGCIGAFLAKRAGALALAKLRDSLTEGGTTLALVDGGLVLAAGVTLLSPGFITDAVGLLLLVAPIRAIAAKAIHARLKQKAGAFADMSNFVGGDGPGMGNMGGMPFVMHMHRSDDPDFADEDDEDPPPPGVIDV